MPTRAEWTALREQCTWTPTRLGDAVGFMVTGPSGNRIFLPEMGFRVDATIEEIGRSGNYWSATVDSEYATYGWYLFLKEEVYYGEYRSSRFYGYPIRPVSE